MGRRHYLILGAIFGAGAGFLVGQAVDGPGLGAAFGLAMGGGMGIGVHDSLEARRRRLERRSRRKRQRPRPQREDPAGEGAIVLGVALDVDRTGTVVDPQDWTDHQP